MQNQEIQAETEYTPRLRDKYRSGLAELNAGISDEHLASMGSRISLAQRIRDYVLKPEELAQRYMTFLESKNL